MRYLDWLMTEQERITQPEERQADIVDEDDRIDAPLFRPYDTLATQYYRGDPTADRSSPGGTDIPDRR